MPQGLNEPLPLLPLLEPASFARPAFWVSTAAVTAPSSPFAEASGSWW